MDILYLLDRLEEALTSGPHVPFTSRSLVDEQEALDILDQIRVAIPEEVKQARRLMEERDSIIAEATRQAERLGQEAETAMRSRVDDHALVQEAERRAEEIRAEALRGVGQMRRDADAYAYRALARTQTQLQALLEQVERGLRALEAETTADNEESAPDSESTRGR